MQEDEKNNIIPLLFVALLAGTFLLFSVLWPPLPHRTNNITVEGTVEEISDWGCIIKCAEFHQVYHTWRFSFALHQDDEIIWQNSAISASELQVGDLVRVSGYGLEPNAVGVHTPVSITTRGEVVLLEHGS